MSKRKQPGDSGPSASGDAAGSEHEAAARRHLRFGWWTLCVFLLLGLVIESLLGLKVGWFVGVDQEMRREMWRLAHAHGTLVSLLNVAFGLSVSRLSRANRRWQTVASPCLLAATFTLPVGFFLGGVWHYSSRDPGLGILLVPVGAVLLLVAAAVTASCVERDRSE